MAYSDNFPATRPVFMADFANGGKIDPRMTFSRSDTPPTYAAPSAVHYWSNEKHLSSDNLLLQSSDFDTAWSKQGLATPTGGQSDPAGGTDGFTLVEDGNGGYHRIYQSMSQTGDLALTVYAKQTAGTRYLMLTLFNASNDYEAAIFDLAGGAAATSSGSSSSYTSVSTSQTSSGGSYYKCVLKATGTVTTVSVSLNDSASAGGVNSSGLDGYAGDGSSSINVAFASLSSVGSTEYVPTTTQIARAYAPTLKSVATSGQPRFEYDPSADGQSVAKGILIEGQSTNLVTYSETLATGWTEGRSTLTAASGVAPDGTLTSNLWTVDGTAANSHNAYYEWTTGGATPQTASVYAKAGNVNYLVMRYSPANGAFTDGYVSFNLSNGTVGTTTGTMTSSSIESCGNGWYRCSITSTALTDTTGRLVLYIAQADNTLSFDGNSYDHIQVWGGQIEANQSFASSYIKSNSGSATTRAAESLSVATADIGYTGGPVSLVTEFDVDAAAPVGSGVVRRFAMAQLGGTEFGLYQATYGGAALLGVAGGSVLTGSSLTAGANKAALSYDTNDVAICANGGAVTTDTSQELIDASGLNFYVGGETGGASALNGHVKRVALYNEALSDTNLQALTS